MMMRYPKVWMSRPGCHSQRGSDSVRGIVSDGMDHLSFDDAATPPELRFAFSQLLELFQLFWASLRGISELTRTRRFPPSRQKERLRSLVELFNFPRDETAQVAKAR